MMDGRCCNRSMMMLNTEVLWSKALTDNNVRGIICWLRYLINGDQCNVKKNLSNFNCWLQRSVELTKKELLTCCFGQHEGLWICLDQNSFAKVQLLTQKLKNLLSLACLGRTLSGPHPSAHISRLTNGMYFGGANATVRWGFSPQDQQTLRQHIFLGRLVQWWSLTGLLPQHPDARELKKISQMWHKMDQNHKRLSLELRFDIGDKYRWHSLIQDITARLVKQHGPLWVSEDQTYQTYPPPSLHALLNLLLLPRVDITSVQAIIMYFVLDVSNFLRCNDDLLKSFCHTFSISPSFSQQIRGFWLMDHGFVSNSMEMLLSPKASSPWMSLHHRSVLRTLLIQGERQAALKYLYYTTPVIESIQDARLYVDVLLQNNRVSEACMLLRQGQPGNELLLEHFVRECRSPSVCAEALTSVCKDMLHLHITERTNLRKPEGLNTENIQHEQNKPDFKDQTPHPLSARVYQSLSNNPLTPRDLITLLRQAVTDLNPSQNPSRELVLWPEYLEITEKNKNMPLTHHVYHPLPDTPAQVELQEDAQKNPELELLEDDLPVLPTEVCRSPSVSSAGSTSPDSMTSAWSFISARSSPPVPSEIPSRHSSTQTVQNPIPTCRHEDCLDDGQLHPENLAPCCPDLTFTEDGATETISFKNLRRESAIELDFYECVEETCMSALPGTISDPAEGTMVEIAQTKKWSKSKFNLPSQCYSNEDNQAVLFTAELPLDSHNFLTPDYEKTVYEKAVSEDIIKSENVTEPLGILSSDQKAESVAHQDSLSSEAPESSSFLELKALRRARSLPLAEEGFQTFHRDSQDVVDQPEILTSCAFTETMQDILDQIHEQDDLDKILKGEPRQTASSSFLRNSALDIDFNPKRCGPGIHQIHIPLRDTLSPHTSPSHSPDLSPSDQGGGKSYSGGKTATTKESACFRTSPDRMGHCKLGSWWKQGLETRRASTGLLPAIEQVPAVSKGWFQSEGPLCLLESSTKPKGGKKEARQGGKEESTSRRGPRNVLSHSVEPGSSAHTGRRGKKGKHFKSS